MPSLFAVSGLAAAAALADWGLLCLGLALTWSAAFFGLLFRSRVLSTVAGAFWLATTLQFQPWEAFQSLTTGDREAAELCEDFRLLAWLWLGATLGTVAACATACQRRKTLA